jgi:hypothetical protein
VRIEAALIAPPEWRLEPDIVRFEIRGGEARRVQ